MILQDRAFEQKFHIDSRVKTMPGVQKMVKTHSGVARVIIAIPTHDSYDVIYECDPDLNDSKTWDHLPSWILVHEVSGNPLGEFEAFALPFDDRHHSLDWVLLKTEANALLSGIRSV